ncbi:hypothetical protein AB9M75_00835 [Lactobacillus sp. AN1001]
MKLDYEPVVFIEAVKDKSWERIVKKCSIRNSKISNEVI